MTLRLYFRIVDMVKCHFGGQIGLNKGFTFLAAVALTSVFAASYAGAGTMQKKKSSGGYSGPETGLLGVKLYDSGLRVITLYGNPDSITTVGGGTGVSSGGPGGGFGGGGGGGAAGSPGQLPPPGGPGGRGGGNRPSNDSIIPGGLIPGTWGEPIPNMQQGPLVPQNAGGSAGPGQPTNTGPSRPGGAGGASGGASNPGASAATESAVFTRWSYTRNGCKLAFVIDKFNRVIQIEAIGLQNQRIKTRRGVGFGSSFSTIMKAYAPSADPDGYDIAGNNFTVRFLTRHRVAFRLSQLSTKKSHVVTGIVVAAGKQ